MNNGKALAYPLFKVAQEKFACAPAQLSPAQREQAEQIARNKIAIENAVLRSNEAAGVSVPPAQLEAAMAQIKERFDDEQVMESGLQKLGIDREDLYDAIARELRVEAVLERVGARSDPVSETDVRLFYYMNPERFQRPEIREARQILITINDDFPENRREEALRRINAIRPRLLKKPERFAEQALKHSECPTSLNGGLMGQVQRGQLYPELEAVLFSLVPGKISEVVESELGFHLLLCDSIQPAGQIPIEDVLPRLTEFLNARQRSRLQRRWLADLPRETVHG